MTDFRARGTIMGLAGLTAVFGMGTGGAPPVSSPEFGRGGGQAPSDVGGSDVGHTRSRILVGGASGDDPSRTRTLRDLGSLMDLMATFDSRRRPGGPAASSRGGQAVGC